MQCTYSGAGCRLRLVSALHVKSIADSDFVAMMRSCFWPTVETRTCTVGMCLCARVYPRLLHVRRECPGEDATRRAQFVAPRRVFDVLDDLSHTPIYDRSLLAVKLVSDRFVWLGLLKDRDSDMGSPYSYLRCQAAKVQHHARLCSSVWSSFSLIDLRSAHYRLCQKYLHLMFSVVDCFSWWSNRAVPMVDIYIICLF